MAHKLTTSETGMPVWVRESFAERKAARIAAGNRKYVFVVEAGYDQFAGERVGEFKSRREAEEFINSDRAVCTRFGAFMSGSKPDNILRTRHPGSICFDNRWRVVRVNKETSVAE